MAEVDPVAEVVAYLRTVTSIDATVGDRIYGGELPRDEVKNMPRGAIIVRPAGGANMGTGTLAAGDTRVDVDCYSTTLLGAWSVYLAIKKALKYMPRTGSLNWAKESSGGTSGHDPDTEWPVTYSSWQIHAGETL